MLKVPNTVAIDRELVLLKRNLGGKIVDQKIGGGTMQVLKLPNGVIVTMQSVRPADKMMLAQQKQDIHVLKGQADISEFAVRYKNFRGASGQA